MCDKIYYFNNANYKVKKEGNRILLISSIEFSILALNETGYLILSLMDGKNTVDTIIEKVVAEYDINENMIKDYTAKFIDKMVNRKVIHIASECERGTCKNQGLNRVYLDLTESQNVEQQLTFEKVKTIVDTISSNEHENTVRFFVKLGVSYLDDGKKKIIQYIGSKPFAKLFLFSDGHCINEELLRELESDIDSVVMELTSYDKKTQLSEIVDKLHICEKNKMHFFVDMVLNDSNMESCLLLQQDMYDYGVNGIFIDDAGVSDMEKLNDFLDRLYLKNNFLNSWKNNRLRDESKKFYILTDKELCLRSLYSHKLKLHCGIGIEEMSIASDGSISPCHLAKESKLCFKDIKDYYDRREKLFGVNLMPKKCKECDGWCLCLSGCKIHNRKCGKGLNETPDDCESVAEAINSYYARL